MSASLVGSEMCIRDRKVTGADGRFLSLRKASLWAADLSAHISLTSFLRPVSYTHLTLPTICSV
eukprot:8550140-Alexandrium_andersonii.AAC.1